MQISLLGVEVVLQDDAPVAQVVAQAEQVVAGTADQPHPERHDLHVTPGARARHGVLAEIAFDLDDRQDELRIEAGAYRLEVHRAQELDPRLEVGDSRLQAARHLRQPVDRRLGILEGVPRRGPVGDRRLQAGADLGRERLVDLGAGERRSREGEAQSEQGRMPPHAFARSGESGSLSGTFWTSLSRLPWYSMALSLSPRSPITMRWGMPMSSMSANMTPGRSSRSSSRTSNPASVSTR